ncbi:hypothetical protein BT67DRAFT_452598 [Trichocladium antarcticum]|uniref:VASt domain-containing protein n=1 Tax=Trichocladium antarcticum TaxID=1450529 RepID=A0AAN6UBX6_9PEZI|nr:hypothetical protein BT67DRAFT_452598 [Trichocladium antarcticum]
MDAPSNGLGKLLPKAIAAKRRRNRASSVAETPSSNDDVVPQQQQRGESATSLSTSSSNPSSIHGSLNGDEITNPTCYDDSDPEYSNRRPSAISAHPSQIGYLTTSSPLVQAAHRPESIDPDSLSKQSTRSSTLHRGSTDSLQSALSLRPSRTTLETPELRSKRSTSASRLKDVFKSKRSSADEKSPVAKDQSSAAPSPKPAAEYNKRLSRGPKLEPLQTRPQTPPQTSPSVEAPMPLIVNTPPTPTDSKPPSARVNSPQLPADAALPKNMIPQRRRAGSSAGPSRLSISSVPLTPTPENGPATQANPATTFFSSMFSAVQNTANSLSTTIPAALTQTASKSRGIPPREQGEREPDTVEVESSAVPGPSTESKEPAVKTLGLGDLSLSQLGIVDAPSAPSPSAARFSEAETRSRSESAPTEPQTAAVDFAEDPRLSRPLSLYDAPGGERTPPPGSVYEGKSGGVHRSGSIRSAIGHRRNRGSSIATHGTTATGATIGAAIAAANSSLGHPPGALGSAPKLTGFAVANKKRNRDFHVLFKSVPDDDYLIEDYSCALQREILAHGRLYISEGHLCFSSNILGWVTTLVMSFDEIVAVEKRSTALVFKNGLEISTLHAKHIFASFASRDTTYDLIIKIWKLGHPQLQSSLNGVRLEEPGGDRTEKIETESVSAVGSHSISGSDAETEDGDEVYDEDEDEEEGEFVQTSDGQIVEPEKAALRKISGALAPSEKPDDGAPAIVADFPGPATHAPTDCGDAGTHYDKLLGDEVIPAPLGKVYSLLFGPASVAWMGRWITTDQKCTDLQMEDMRGLSDEVRSRTYSYIKPLYAPIGPKQTKCIVTEQIDNFDLEKAINISISTQNPDVPSGNIFVVKTKYCLTWGENNGTRVQVNCTIEWSGKSWLKGAIERGANEGQLAYVKDLFTSLRAAVSTRSRSSILASGAVRGKKRTRKSKSALAPSPASDIEAAKVSAKQHWGFFEPVRPLLGPIVGMISPILTGNVVYGLLVGLLVASWFGFGTRQGAPRYTHDPAYANYPQRVAAYDEMWRREESELWEWIEERVGMERLGAEPPVRRRSVDPATVRERLREERMHEREIKEAIRVTEEHLGVLKKVVDGKGAGR